MGAHDRSSRGGGRDTLDDTSDGSDAHTYSSERSVPDAAFRPTALAGAPLPIPVLPPRELPSESIELDHPGFDDDSDPFGALSTGANLGGRYRLEKILGKGATGVVFEASHLVIGKRVALKCLYPHHRANPNAVERFFREARIAATVEHPNVIQVFDGGDEKDTLFLAMELLEGESLGDRLERGALPVEDTIRMFLAIMSGVAAVHEAGVVHRDLKPDNVFLVSGRFHRKVEPKVLDFGISKLKEPGMRELTTAGTVMGTPYYMAPEQIANTRDVDVRADVYSLGVMLYEALAGDVPYAAESVLDIFRAAEEGGAKPLNEVRPDVTPALAAIIARAMHADRNKRFESVAELANAIEALGLEVTDPERERPPVPDVRATVRDGFVSPLWEMEQRRKEEGRITPTADAPAPSARLSAPRPEERRTVPLQAPLIIERMPRWVIPALAGAGALTLASLVAALVALLV